MTPDQTDTAVDLDAAIAQMKWEYKMGNYGLLKYQKFIQPLIRAAAENSVLRAKFPEPPEGWKWVMQPIAEDPWHDEKEGC